MVSIDRWKPILHISVSKIVAQTRRWCGRGDVYSTRLVQQTSIHREYARRDYLRYFFGVMAAGVHTLVLLGTQWYVYTMYVVYDVYAYRHRLVHLMVSTVYERSNMEETTINFDDINVVYGFGFGFEIAFVMQNLLKHLFICLGRNHSAFMMNPCFTI